MKLIVVRQAGKIEPCNSRSDHDVVDRSMVRYGTMKIDYQRTLPRSQADDPSQPSQCPETHLVAMRRRNSYGLKNSAIIQPCNLC